MLLPSTESSTERPLKRELEAPAPLPVGQTSFLARPCFGPDPSAAIRLRFATPPRPTVEKLPVLSLSKDCDASDDVFYGASENGNNDASAASWQGEWLMSPFLGLVLRASRNGGRCARLARGARPTNGTSWDSGPKASMRPLESPIRRRRKRMPRISRGRFLDRILRMNRMEDVPTLDPVAWLKKSCVSCPSCRKGTRARCGLPRVGRVADAAPPGLGTPSEPQPRRQPLQRPVAPPVARPPGPTRKLSAAQARREIWESPLVAASRSAGRLGFMSPAPRPSLDRPLARGPFPDPARMNLEKAVHRSQPRQRRRQPVHSKQNHRTTTQPVWPPAGWRARPMGCSINSFILRPLRCPCETHLPHLG
jgi:hypothetical protein